MIYLSYENGSAGSYVPLFILVLSPLILEQTQLLLDEL